MANTLLSYGWTPDSAVAASGDFGGGTNTSAPPNNGDNLAWSQNLTRSYPSWLNPYGYQGSLATNQDKTFAAPGVDPYSLLPSHATDGAPASPSAAPDVSPQGATNGGFQGPEMNAVGGVGTGEMPSWGGIKDFIGSGIAAARGFPGAMMDAVTGGPSGTAAMGASDINPAQSGEQGDARGLHKGGMVTRNRLSGPDPRGPDDGYAALNVGEGVLTAEALKHYGKGIIGRLNKLSIAKDLLR